MLRRRITFIAMVAVATSSCSLRYFDDGTARLSWSIAGSQEPASCASRGAPAVHIVVRREDGTVVNDDRGACSSFERGYVLHRGWYTASLTLVDASAAPVSETRDSNAFYVTPSFDASERVDFSLAPPAP